MPHSLRFKSRSENNSEGFLVLYVNIFLNFVKAGNSLFSRWKYLTLPCIIRMISVVITKVYAELYLQKAMEAVVMVEKGMNPF